MPVNPLHAETLAHQIHALVNTKRMSYLDAVLYVCEQRNIEPELIAPLLGDKIKFELANEATRLHFLKRRIELPF